MLQLGNGRRKKAEISPGAGRSPTGTAGKIGELFQACLEERKADRWQGTGRQVPGHRHLGRGSALARSHPTGSAVAHRKSSGTSGEGLGRGGRQEPWRHCWENHIDLEETLSVQSSGGAPQPPPLLPAQRWTGGCSSRSRRDFKPLSPSFPSAVPEKRRALPRHLHTQNCLISTAPPSPRARQPSQHSRERLVGSSLRHIPDFTASSSARPAL